MWQDKPGQGKCDVWPETILTAIVENSLAVWQRVKLAIILDCMYPPGKKNTRNKLPKSFKKCVLSWVLKFILLRLCIFCATVSIDCACMLHWYLTYLNHRFYKTNSKTKMVKSIVSTVNTPQLSVAKRPANAPRSEKDKVAYCVLLWFLSVLFV